jgi:threonine dehydratase
MQGDRGRAEAGNDVQQSLRAGHIVKIDTPRTIADGAQTQAPGDLTFAIIQQRVNEVLTVNDEQLVQAMRFMPSA